MDSTAVYVFPDEAAQTGWSGRDDWGDWSLATGDWWRLESDKFGKSWLQVTGWKVQDY